MLTLMSYPQLVAAPQNTPASACSDSSISVALVLVIIALTASSVAITVSGTKHRHAPRLKKASPDIRKHCGDSRMRQLLPNIRDRNSRSSSRKLLVLLLLAYPTLVAAPNSSSVGDSSLSTSTISAAAALVIGVNSYVHRTRKWARDESRIKASCLKYEVQYTPPEINENQQDQSKRRSRLKEECRMHQKRKRRSKRAEDEKKKRSLETPVEKARHAE